MRGARNQKHHPGTHLSAAALLATSLCLLAVWFRPSRADVTVRDLPIPPQVRTAVWNRTPGSRRVYPFSVVAGGVYSGDEVRRALRADPVIAEHYRDINSTDIHPVSLDRPLMRYVSFRKGNQVYWTRQRMPIPAGETLLADGDSLVRARCGNRLSEQPQEPVLPLTDRQPTVSDFEAPLPPEAAPPPLAAMTSPAGVGSPDFGSNSQTTEEPVFGSHSGAAGVGTAQAAVTSPRGFGGFNVMGGSAGGGIPPPSANPALSGRDSVAALNPDQFGRLPAQVLLQLPSPELLQPSVASENVFAVLTPFLGNSSTSIPTVGLPNTGQTPNSPVSVGQGSTPTSPSPVPSGPAISSIGRMTPVMPGSPSSTVLLWTSQIPGSTVRDGARTTDIGGGSGGSTPGILDRSTTNGGGDGFTPVDTSVPEPKTLILIATALSLFPAIRRSRSR